MTTCAGLPVSEKNSSRKLAEQAALIRPTALGTPRREGVRKVLSAFSVYAHIEVTRVGKGLRHDGYS